MKKFRTRLTIIFITLVGISVLAAGMIMGDLYKSSHLRLLEDHMSREAKLIAVSEEWPAAVQMDDLLAYYTERTRLWKESADIRVTIIRTDGVVLGDSDYDPRTMDNHADREEIRGAASEGTGVSIRRSGTLGHSRMYIALPLPKEAELNGFIRLSMSLEDVEADIRKLWFYWTFGFILLMGAAAFVSYRIAGSMARPLEKIARVAHRITNRDFSSRVNAQSDDELGSLGRVIDTMADSLQRQMEHNREQASRLTSVLDNMISGILMIDRDGRIALMNRSAESIAGVAANEWIGQPYRETHLQPELIERIDTCTSARQSLKEDVAFHYPEERMVEVQLVPMFREDEEWTGTLVILQDMTAIRKLERMRSEFVANVSHELKTPIAAVQGFAETLMAGAIHDPETAGAFLQIIYDESHRLNRLIGDLLELSKMESKTIPLSFSPIDVRSFVDKVVSMMQAEADKKQITLHVEGEEGLYIEADEDRLQQILFNLLSNGINYTPEGGRVSIAIEAVGSSEGGHDEESSNIDKVRLTIQDTGIGIPKKDLPRIFERFYRVDKARSRMSGGTGLGLSIIKHLVDLHHGTIRVESTVGFGTTLIIELPVLQ